MEQIPVNYHALKDRLVNLQRLYFVTRDAYALGYPQFNRKTDVRLTVFAKCINIINSTTFGAQCMIDNILDDGWWNGTSPWSDWTRNDPTYNKAIPIREYDYFLRLGFLFGIYSSIESSFRDYIRALLPSNGTADFWCIYKKLFEMLEVDQEYDKLLSLFSIIRNSLHNNGIYYSQRNPDDVRIITYKGEPYTFYPKQPVRVNWELALMITRDCKDMLFQIVNHNDMTAIPEIRDIAAVVQPPG